MTEAEWLSSTDPAAMLHYLQYAPFGVGGRLRGTAEGGPPLISDRKLRLWVEACRAIAAPTAKWSESMGLESMVDDWSRPHLSWLKECPMSVRAAILREIVGSPFRPVVLPVYSRCTKCGYEFEPAEKRFYGCPQCVSRGPFTKIDCPWLTEQVKALAHAAYENTSSHKCGRCKGHGYVGPGRVMNGPVVEDCPDCNCSGRVGVGTLDNQRLAVLSDCLEDAGCDDAAILEHLRSPAPHVRGCYVLDAILGKS